MAEKIVLELGESQTLSAKGKGGRWATTGSAAVIETDDLEASSVKVVGASVGRVNVFYKRALDLSREEAVAAKVIGGNYMEKLEQANTETFEVEVVEKGKKPQPVAAGISPMTTSSQLDGLTPMTEAQDGPSEKTPYGMDQENKPVMPTGSMVSPGATNIARATEDAVAKGPGAAAAEAASEASASKQAASKAASKAATKATSKTKK